MAGLEGKTALITGASRGIGRAIAKRLAQDGAKIVVNYARNVVEADAVVADIKAAGGEAFAIACDVSDLGAVDAMFAELRERIGALDILVNNAGRGSSGPTSFPNFTDITPEDYDAVFGLNTRGLFFVTQHAVKMMRDDGRIITISSMAAKIRMPGLATYSASKAAADAFTRILAMELAPRRITINSINSGIVETDMTAGITPDRKAHLISMIPLGRIGQVGDIADVAAFLASDASRWITGHEIPASGGRYI